MNSKVVLRDRGHGDFSLIIDGNPIRNVVGYSIQDLDFKEGCVLTVNVRVSEIDAEIYHPQGIGGSISEKDPVDDEETTLECQTEDCHHVFPIRRSYDFRIARRKLTNAGKCLKCGAPFLWGKSGYPVGVNNDPLDGMSDEEPS